MEALAFVLNLITQYGVDSVFMVWFFLLYRKNQKYIYKLQEERLEDARQTLGVIMESKQVIGSLVEANNELARRLESWVLEDEKNSEEE